MNFAHAWSVKELNKRIWRIYRNTDQTKQVLPYLSRTIEKKNRSETKDIFETF